MSSPTEPEFEPEAWARLLGVNVETYRRAVLTDPLVHALDTLCRQLVIRRQAALERCRELQTSESTACYWVAAEIEHLLGAERSERGAFLGDIEMPQSALAQVREMLHGG